MKRIKGDYDNHNDKIVMVIRAIYIALIILTIAGVSGILVLIVKGLFIVFKNNT